MSVEYTLVFTRPVAHPEGGRCEIFSFDLGVEKRQLDSSFSIPDYAETLFYSNAEIAERVEQLNDDLAGEKLGWLGQAIELMQAECAAGCDAWLRIE